ncbi:hypothetical protein FB567DRAFT_82912 [Paraphoma chrysanthemicola]|uniref:Uncharacterized protein n=1 Tax=Paraphoma chrysanthemicola TaxID=798071 RepID=A0A8K0VX39_9PLEO|nr:hypothetical protein FB567DRAFT_82912 [Paraphoma chrysanthemicola]
MKFIATTASIVAIAAAAADPQVTPRAELAQRQNSDPAFLGYISAATFSDARSCDFPATLSRSGSLAQCCASASCTFWSSCSAGTLFASQTSLFCDQGYCNTAVLVPTVGASSGQNYLGCWATSLGQNPFTIVANIGSASVGQLTSARSGNSALGRASSITGSVARSSVTSAAGSGSPTQSATGASQSTGAASAVGVTPVTGAIGLVAMAFGLL